MTTANDRLEVGTEARMRSIATEPKKAEGNVLVPAAALEKLLDGRELYFHPKTGNVYALVLRRPLYAPLLEGEHVFPTSSASDSRYALVTDSMSSGEVVFYQNISTGDFYARPAAMFDEPQRFVRILATLEPAEAAAGGEERATELLDEWRDLLIQERLANRSWDSLTEEERRIPTGTEYSRSSRRISLEQRTLDFQGEEEVRQRMALKIAAIRAALQPEAQS